MRPTLRVFSCFIGAVLLGIAAPQVFKLARPAKVSSRPDREQQLAVRFTRPWPRGVADLIKEHAYHEDMQAGAGEYWGGVLERAKGRDADAREQLRSKHTPDAVRQTSGDSKYASREAAEAWAKKVSSLDERRVTDNSQRKRDKQFAKQPSRVVLHLSASEREAAESQKAAARAWAEEVSAVTKAGGDLEASFRNSDRQQKPPLQGQQNLQRKLGNGHRVPRTHTEAALSDDAADAAKARAWAEAVAKPTWHSGADSKTRDIMEHKHISFEAARKEIKKQTQKDEVYEVAHSPFTHQ